MRREGFQGDDVTPTATTAPDLLIWDSTRYTNFPKLLIGGIGTATDAQASLSSGNEETQILLSGNYHRQASVFPGNLSDQRAGMYASITHRSLNKRFTTDFTVNLTEDKNISIAQDLTASINLAPDYPTLSQPGGALNWSDKGITFTSNPLAYLLDRYTAQTGNLLSHLQGQYRILPGLSLKASVGYNSIQVNETGVVPIAAQDPTSSPTGFAQFGNRSLLTWIAEPQVDYTTSWGKSEVTLLAGATWQGLNGSNTLTSAYGYRDDALLGTTNGATGLSAQQSNTQYRYEAVFSRLKYNWEDRYIIDLSARRDGSSRFGPGKQFAGFGAVGGAWIFSKTRFIKNSLSVLSFGKLRASYGTTGNDQIGDYQYLDIWSSTPYPYLGSASLYPVRLYNPYYSWEINKKLEVALELGFLNDRILLTSAVYRDRGGNQLIRYGLPLQTGFSGITENFPALVQNEGLEEELITRNIVGRSFSWSSTVNLTLPRNQLLSFPGIATSSYSNLEVGQPLSIVDGYAYTGVERSTGIYAFKDLNKDGQISYPQDYVKNIAHLAPDLYGGLGNNVRYRGWALDIFASFRFQTAPNYVYYYYNNGYIPGTLYNQPVDVENHWQKPGQAAPFQRFTAGYNAAAYVAAYNLANSSAAYSNASFLRLTNLSLSYSLPAGLTKKWGLTGGKVFLRGQNLLTITRYRGSDPETQNAYVLPPLKIAVAGVQCQF
jgi:TonB-dependent starch-binding outer membrane protein SusC